MDNNTLLAAVGAGVVILILVGVWAASRRRRTDSLKSKFGPDYDHAVERFGGRSKAETELETRARRFEKAEIRPLGEADRERYLQAWQATQARFVDSPVVAVTEADRLVDEVMRLRGYPVSDSTQRMADVAIGHPHLADHYRSATGYARSARDGKANTEDLRQAFVHYRALFDDLLAAREQELVGAR